MGMVDDHPLLYGNNGSLDPGTNGGLMKMFYSSLNLEVFSFQVNLCVSPKSASDQSSRTSRSSPCPQS